MGQLEHLEQDMPQLLGRIDVEFLACKLDDARAAASITLILIAAILTSLGWFAPIARHAGAGTIVPITGFANSVVSPAIEFKREGLVIGVCAKMFTIAGPVLVYGITASTVFGLILWIIEKVRGA